MSGESKINPTWAASIERRMGETREALRRANPAQVAERSGAACQVTGEETHLEVQFWGRPYRITWPGVTMGGMEGEPCPLPVEAALVQYLSVADGTPLGEEWVSLGNLPHGAFYEQAFQGYSGKLLAREFRGDVEGFRAAAERVGGERIDMGNAAYRFWAFPRVPIAVVYWSGGDEFPDDAQVLFDRSACHYQPVEMLAHLGSTVCERLMQARQG
jgi:hypothetical protein